MMGHERRNICTKTNTCTNIQRPVCSHTTLCKKGSWSGLFEFLFNMFFERLVWLRFNISIAKQGVWRRAAVWNIGGLALRSADPEVRTDTGGSWRCCETLDGSFQPDFCHFSVRQRWWGNHRGWCFQTSFQRRIPSHALSLSVGGHSMQRHGSWCTPFLRLMWQPGKSDNGESWSVMCFICLSPRLGWSNRSVQGVRANNNPFSQEIPWLRLSQISVWPWAQMTGDTRACVAHKPCDLNFEWNIKGAGAWSFFKPQ